MAQFLDTFDVERAALLKAVTRFEGVWDRFQEQSALPLDGHDNPDSLISSELAAVRRGLEQTRLTVGIFGLIKRGKSTLLNGILGLEVSSMHVTPETAVPVYVDYGEVPQATVFFADGSVKHVAVEEVSLYTSQKHNANNQKGVLHVHQQVQVGFLRNGVRLVDTPGLDDAQNDEIYTERTLQELDTVDAGVVVFMSPPTIGATELEFLEKVASRQLKKVFLVCNMYPRHFFDPETRRDVLAYIGGRIVEASRRVGLTGKVRIYPVCAIEAWEARQELDIERYKASGVSLLHRELETFLSDQAGRQVLNEAAQRIGHAAELARSEVGVRERLLDDPAMLAAHRSRLDANVRTLEQEVDAAAETAVQGVDPLRMRVRGMIMNPFPRAKRAVKECNSLDEIELFAARFRREIEVASEAASRTFQSGFESVIDRLRATLQERFDDVMIELNPTAPKVVLSGRAFLLTPDQLQALRRDVDPTLTQAISGAAAGSILSGAAAIAFAGGILGPLGLLAGALVGWKFGGLLGGSRGLERAKQLLLERLDEVAEDLARDFDAQVDLQLSSLREVVRRRRRSFAADIYRQLELAETLAEDPERSDAFRRSCQQFLEAFDSCARAALRFSTVEEEPLSAAV